MLHVLKEKDKKVFVVAIDVLSDGPFVVRRWYPTGVPANKAKESIGEFENMEVKPYRGAEHGGIYDLPSRGLAAHNKVTLEKFGLTECAHLDTIPVKKPKTRLKGDVYWSIGEWRIRGVKGDQLLALVDLTKYLA